MISLIKMYVVACLTKLGRDREMNRRRAFEIAAREALIEQDVAAYSALRRSMWNVSDM